MVRKTKEEASRTRQQIIDAARTVFHQRGVSRATLEHVAQAAGVTRGAVYWHFKDKSELFLAVREDVFAPLLEQTDAILNSEEYADPLDAIEAALKKVFQLMEECAAFRQVYEIMALRCEYVGEFSSVQVEVKKPTYEFLDRMEGAYRRAAAKGTLRAGLDPIAVTRDTWAFSSGLTYLFLGSRLESEMENQISEMVSAHMALRRAS